MEDPAIALEPNKTQRLAKSLRVAWRRITPAMLFIVEPRKVGKNACVA